MQTTYLQQIMTYFRNLALNAVGVERDLYRLIQDKDIEQAIALMQNRDVDVDEALREYNPQTHAVMRRPNKYRKNDRPYITEKLPRTRQRYINEVELFFLFANPIEWKREDGSEEAFTLFKEFLNEQRFNSKMRQIKRLAGAETEVAKLYHIYREGDNEIKVRSVVMSRSTGRKLRPLFDQYGNLSAFAYGYALKQGTQTVYHWDIQTPQFLFFCQRGKLGWDVQTYENPTGKINIVYYQQKKAWDGAEARINREEFLDSKVGDTNNYFSDPIAMATADVVENMTDPNKPGKLIQLTGSGSRFEYVNPPQASQTRESEKKDLNDSILFDTFTPDFSFDQIRGMGTLSGAAIKNSMILGYIKRDNLKEIYEENVDREKNIILSILKLKHPNLASEFDNLRITFSFSEPFATDTQNTWSSIVQVYQAGLCSLEQAVSMLALTNAPDEEVKRIKEAEKANIPPKEDKAAEGEKSTITE